MYKILKNGRKVRGITFDTYEKCRQWVRKKLRSMRDKPGYIPHRSGARSIFDLMDAKHRTPTLLSHGYSIRKVEG